jgi:hypothetical protein
VSLRRGVREAAISLLPAATGFIELYDRFGSASVTYPRSAAVPRTASGERAPRRASGARSITARSAPIYRGDDPTTAKQSPDSARSPLACVCVGPPFIRLDRGGPE